MPSDELTQPSAVELASMIRTRKVSSVDVTKAVLDRIEQHNPAINAFVTIHREEALCSAQKADEALMSGQRVGPLNGVPFHVKDNLYVAGSRTTFGSKLTETNVTADECHCRRLSRCGTTAQGRDDSGWPNEHSRTRVERSHRQSCLWNYSKSLGSATDSGRFQWWGCCGSGCRDGINWRRN